MSLLHHEIFRSMRIMIKYLIAVKRFDPGLINGTGHHGQVLLVPFVWKRYPRMTYYAILASSKTIWVASHTEL